MLESKLDRLRDVHRQMKTELQRVIVGQEEVLDQLLLAILTRGHCLLVGVPGLAKTLMISSLAKTLDLSFNRIQFTPDLMPSDITGTELLHIDPETSARSFRFEPGPLFANVVLADEINRTPPKTQAALLEAMQERQVTSGGQTHPLPEPFFVLATQNPIEQEGTYPLPEAQLDRFMFMVQVGYPDARRRSARSCKPHDRRRDGGGHERGRPARSSGMQAGCDPRGARRRPRCYDYALGAHARATRVRAGDAAAVPPGERHVGRGPAREPVPRARRQGARGPRRPLARRRSRTCAPSPSRCCATAS